MIGLALCAAAGIALLGVGAVIAFRPPKCGQCEERHADPLEECDAAPMTLRPVEMQRRGVGQ